MNIAVIGGYKCSKTAYQQARRVGQLIAQEGWILVCGGRTGVMEAASRGAKEFGGMTVGILPSYDGRDANKFLDVKIPTGLGYARNILVVRAAQAVIAIDGKYGTLSEIAFAFNENKPVIGINTWDIPGIIKVSSAEQAMAEVKKKVAPVGKRNLKKNSLPR